MSNRDKIIERIKRRDSDYGIRFDDVRALLRALGFTESISGSHHVFRKTDCGIINLQPAGKDAKGYQVR